MSRLLIALKPLRKVRLEQWNKKNKKPTRKRRLFCLDLLC